MSCTAWDVVAHGTLCCTSATIAQRDNAVRRARYAYFLHTFIDEWASLGWASLGYGVASVIRQVVGETVSRV